jgi:DNA-binding CsgD family transcriptional regulator
MADTRMRDERGFALPGADIDLLEGSDSSHTLHPLRFLGMGLLIAWLCCTHIDFIYLPGPRDVRVLAETGMRVGDIGTFIVMAIAARRIGPLSGHRIPTSVLVTITAVGTAVIGLVVAPADMGPDLLFATSVVTAIGGAVLFCLWAEVFCQMGTTSMVVYGGGSCVAAFAVYCLVSTMMQPYAVIATSLLPVFSLACLWASFKLVPREAPRTKEVSYPVPWKIVAIMGIAGVLSGLTGVVLGEAANLGAIHRIWATACAGALMLYMALWRPSMFDMRMMTQVCLAVTVVALIFVPGVAMGFGQVVSFLMKLAYVWFTVFVIAVLANLAYRFDLPSLRLFAIARVCSESGIFVGVMLREAIGRSDIVLDAPTLAGASLVGFALVGICVLIWRSEKTVNADWGAAGISLENGGRVESPRERLIARCGQVASEFGLTERETEMLMLIGQGKTRSQIEQELFLSQNTVKTHIRHLYGKLGVHSKEEACALIGVE